LPNKDRRLKPDTYVTVVLHGETVDRLVVPQPALIDTGARKYALLALPDGYFSPRDVEVGPPFGDFYSVISGLAEGDRVVTSAQFLIDSETNLMSAMQNMAMSMPGMDTGSKKATPGAVPPASGRARPMPPMPGMSAPASSQPPARAPTPSPALSTTPTPTSPPPPQSMSSMPGMKMP
jgi:Cu(I)/Ag(I) efflux system membrane fusion protein